MRTKYNRNSHLESKHDTTPLMITLIGSCKERKRVPIKAITKQYVIVAVDDREERVYEISTGRGQTGCDWYYIANRSLGRLLAFVKGI